METDPVDTDPLALQNQVCFSLAVAARTVIGLYRPVLEPLGLIEVSRTGVAAIGRGPDAM